MFYLRQAQGPRNGPRHTRVVSAASIRLEIMRACCDNSVPLHCMPVRMSTAVCTHKLPWSSRVLNPQADMISRVKSSHLMYVALPLLVLTAFRCRCPSTSCLSPPSCLHPPPAWHHRHHHPYTGCLWFTYICHDTISRHRRPCPSPTLWLVTTLNLHPWPAAWHITHSPAHSTRCGQSTAASTIIMDLELTYCCGCLYRS
jgi:hypothetical protein